MERTKYVDRFNVTWKTLELRKFTFGDKHKVPAGMATPRDERTQSDDHTCLKHTLSNK